MLAKGTREVMKQVVLKQVRLLNHSIFGKKDTDSTANQITLL